MRKCTIKNLKIMLKSMLITVIVLSVLIAVGWLGWELIKAIINFIVFLISVALGIWEG